MLISYFDYKPMHGENIHSVASIDAITWMTSLNLKTMNKYYAVKTAQYLQSKCTILQI